MGTSLTPFEAISYELNKFIERRVADRRGMPRDSIDRRCPPGDRMEKTIMPTNTANTVNTAPEAQC